MAHLDSFMAFADLKVALVLKIAAPDTIYRELEEREFNIVDIPDYEESVSYTHLTCLAPIYLGQERGYDFKVFADETRPLLQGARLTSWELSKSGIDVTLICDNMASIVMKNGWIDAVVVGCDRMAANGDGANKILSLIHI